MRSDNPKASVTACNSILDRGLGKATQAVDLSGEVKTITVQVLQKLPA
jgi:hypothetical protein